MIKPKLISLPFRFIIIVLAILAGSPSAHANLFVLDTTESEGRIGEYNNSGTPINPSLISGTFSRDIAISGNKLFVLSSPGTVGVYTTSGQTINASLITGLGSAEAIAAEGNNLFIGTGENGGTVSEYTTSGALVNASLIGGLHEDGFIGDLAISGGNLFVASVALDGSAAQSTVGEYTLSGMAVNSALITINDALATALAVSGSDIFVRNSPTNEETTGIDTIGEYTTSGALVDPLFINGLTDPFGIAISGNDLYVAEGGLGSGRIGKYTTSGEPIDPSLIDGLDFAFSVVVTGSPNGVPESFPTLWLALPVLGLFAAARFGSLRKVECGVA